MMINPWPAEIVRRHLPHRLFQQGGSRKISHRLLDFCAQRRRYFSVFIWSRM